MKNKYFGDINDYHKYGLLRTLCNRGEIGTAVCWMLTPDGNRKEAQVPAYLQEGDKYEPFDPELFGSLARCLKAPGRCSVRLARRPGILPFAAPFVALLPQDADERRRYFRRFLVKAQACPLVFFDPDTGLKLMFSPRRGKTSGAHLYADELMMTFDAGHSVLVYQHFPHKPRGQFVRDMSIALRQMCRVPTVFSFRTPRVVFLLVAQPDFVDYFEQRSRVVRKFWGHTITVTRQRAANSAMQKWAVVNLDPELFRALRVKAAR